jgi:hypothetical protein
MKILILGDVIGLSGRKAIKKNLSKIINDNEIDFTIINGENAADDGRGITKSIAEEFFLQGVDVITSGNHIWDKQETTDYIDKERRLLRPANLVEGSPGNGYGIYSTKNKKFKVGVINLMGNVFMKKTEDVFEVAKKIKDKIVLKNNVDFIVVDFHGEITSEKMAIGHFFDGEATLIIGTHTHVPTSDARVLKQGTAYQTDAGMCGDYNSVIGMNKDNSINRFLKKKSQKHFPATGEASLCGSIVECNEETGLANNINQFIFGGDLKNLQ